MPDLLNAHKDIRHFPNSKQGDAPTFLRKHGKQHIWLASHSSFFYLHWYFHFLCKFWVLVPHGRVLPLTCSWCINTHMNADTHICEPQTGRIDAHHTLPINCSTIETEALVKNSLSFHVCTPIGTSTVKRWNWQHPAGLKTLGKLWRLHAEPVIS